MIHKYFAEIQEKLTGVSISERKMTYLGMNIWYNHFVRVLSELG